MNSGYLFCCIIGFLQQIKRDFYKSCILLQFMQFPDIEVSSPKNASESIRESPALSANSGQFKTHLIRLHEICNKILRYAEGYNAESIVKDLFISID